MLTVIESQSRAPLSEASSTAELTPGIRLTRKLAPGEVLFREGDPRAHVFRVESGALCLYRSRPDGTHVVVEFAFPGDLVGLGYLDSQVSCAQATMETALSCLPRTQFEPAADATASARLTLAIEREVAFLEEQRSRETCANQIQRVAALFVTLAHQNSHEGRDRTLLTDSLTCGVVASYLNMSVDDLAAQLTELERRGMVEPCEHGLRLKNLALLEQLCDRRPD